MTSECESIDVHANKYIFLDVGCNPVPNKLLIRYCDCALGSMRQSVYGGVGTCVSCGDRHRCQVR